MVQTWSSWKRFPDVESGGHVEAPIGPGVYEVRHTHTGRVVAFGPAGNVAQALSELKVNGGVGAFARLLAARAGAVLAIEESASAIRDARWNLRETPNVEIIQAKVEDVLPGMTRQLDGLVIDTLFTKARVPIRSSWSS